jgi:predicted  nucleic acid-binding Zn-ribbon protein
VADEFSPRRHASDPAAPRDENYHQLELQIVLLRRDLVETQARITRLERILAANVREAEQAGQAG